MICAVSWFCAQHCGVYAPGGRSWQKPSSASSASGEKPALIDRPVKYYGRMTAESRFCLFAASVALRAANSPESGDREVGLISAGVDGWLEANQNYFGDYVSCGRTLGRGNLFIYTLPTSASGEVAIALGLIGPCLFVRDDAAPLPSLVASARRIVADGEADLMLALWSDPRAAVCMVVNGQTGDDRVFAEHLKLEPNPLHLADQLQSMVPKS